MFVGKAFLLFLKGKIMQGDTIAAIATALTNSGIGIVRMSGGRIKAWHA